MLAAYTFCFLLDGLVMPKKYICWIYKLSVFFASFFFCELCLFVKYFDDCSVFGEVRRLLLYFVFMYDVSRKICQVR